MEGDSSGVSAMVPDQEIDYQSASEHPHSIGSAVHRPRSRLSKRWMALLHLFFKDHKPMAKFMAPLTRRETTKDLEDPIKRIDQPVLGVLAVIFLPSFAALGAVGFFGDLILKKVRLFFFYEFK